MTFQEQILQGIPEQLPELPVYDSTLNHPPKRKELLNKTEKKLAIRNALRYFEPKHHPFLAKEFADELKKYGRIYMYRFRPQYEMYARPIHEYPGKCEQAKAIMHMIQNNLDVRVAQHPHELITYGGNGAVFQNWAQYLLTMKYLSEMTCEQTLVMYSGHPMGLFPSHKEAPRVVVTNGMMIPNYSKPDDWEKFNALGVTQYGQMTAGSYMYIGPQGIVHGTTITVLNAMRKLKTQTESHPLPIQRRGENEKGKFSYMTAKPSMYKLIKEFKEQNANNPTQAEKMLWESLKNKQLDGFKFRRQHIIDEFIVDFVCLSQKLVIEVDGKYHNNPDVKEYDILRTELLNSLGFTVIRFSNDEIIGNHESVLLQIKNQLIQTPSPLGRVGVGLSPSPLGRVGVGLSPSPLGRAGEGLVLFVTSGLGGMSGAQPKAGNIAGCITVCAEVNPKITHIRHNQKWVDEIIDNLDALVERVSQAKENREVVSIAYLGNVVDVWEKFDAAGVKIDIGSDQTSLHNPWAGGYYPIGLTFEEANKMMAENPSLFKEKVQASLRRHADAINKHTAKGTYFFDYGNAFLLEASRAGADVMNADESGFKYPSYVEDIMGPMCFDYGFGPFRWVCTSADPDDLAYTDQLATEVLERLKKESPAAVQLQMDDNIQWIKGAQENNLVVGSQARILYADAYGRIAIAQAFNKAVREGLLSAPVVLGRDHHDVSGTDSPYRETSNIYDGSRFTADMAIQNVIGDSFRGATWVSIHNGGGVGWGEVINGGFGMVLDGSTEADHRLKNMLFWDVNNGIARRSWARNEEAVFSIQRAMQDFPTLKVTLPQIVADELLDQLDY